MTFIPDSEITNNEILYRAIPNQPNFWNEIENRPTSALFKDAKGVSVDRDGERTEDEILSKLLQCRKDYGAGKIAAEICNSIDLYLKPDKRPENDYHALILASEDKIQISNGKARKLSKEFNLLIKPENFR